MAFVSIIADGTLFVNNLAFYLKEELTFTRLCAIIVPTIIISGRVRPRL
jgi:hypothetical protein